MGIHKNIKRPPEKVNLLEMRCFLFVFFGIAKANLDFDNINYEVKTEDLIAAGFQEYYSLNADDRAAILDMKNYGTKKTLFVGCGLKSSPSVIKLGAFTTPDDFFDQQTYTTSARANRGYFSYYNQGGVEVIGFSGGQTVNGITSGWDYAGSVYDASSVDDNSKLSLYTKNNKSLY